MGNIAGTMHYYKRGCMMNSKTKNTCTMIEAPPSTLGSSLHVNSAFNHMITYIPGCDYPVDRETLLYQSHKSFFEKQPSLEYT